MRILILIAIGLLLYVIIGNLLRRNKPPTPKLSTEKMVKCRHCDLHILEQEAIQSGDDYYCSQEHLESHHQSK
ncbi:MAG: PP0621 family protein [Methylophagaceae bacterium]